MLIQPMHDEPCPESPYNEIYAKEEKYHHSCKGCKVEMRRDNKFVIGSGRVMNYAYCATHNIYLGRQGFEFHFYNGMDSRSLNAKQTVLTCKQCSRGYSTNTEDLDSLCRSCINIKES